MNNNQSDKFSQYRLNTDIPPPPPPTNATGSSSSSNSIGSPTEQQQQQQQLSPNNSVPKVIHRRHSRKRSSQVLIPPVKLRRKSSTSDVDDELAGDDRNNADEVREEMVTESAFATSASFLIGGQFFAKLLTFGLNQMLLKLVDPTLFGINATLELVINTILICSRESIRLATQRQTLSGKSPDPYRFEGGVVDGTVSGTKQQVVNSGFVSLLAGLPFSLVICVFYYYNNADIPYIGTATLIFGVASIVELIGEPLFLLTQLQFEFKKRAMFESVAIMVRCALTFLFVMLARGKNFGIIAFALGQLAYSGVLTTLYLSSGWDACRHKPFKVFTMQGVWVDGGDGVSGAAAGEYRAYLQPETRQLAISMLLQSIFKHILSEGDKMLIGGLLRAEDQGVYAVVTNYGALIARLLFFPVEEALRNSLSKLVGSTVSKEGVTTSQHVLRTVLRLYCYLSTFAVIFGPVCAPYLLQFMVSNEWVRSEAPKVLATYTLYIPFMALNGSLEAFVQSVATTRDIRRQGVVMVVFSVSFAVVAYVFMHSLRLGVQGLVYANMVNMALRIGWCVQYIEAFYQRVDPQTTTRLQWLRSSMPHWTILGGGVVAGVVSWKYIGAVAKMEQLVHNVALAAVLLALMAYNEPELIKQGTSTIVNRVVKQRRASGPAKSAPTINEEGEEDDKNK